MKLSIVIPAYNEERTIHLILDKVLAVKLDGGMDKEIILVNDCSKDDSKGAIEKYIGGMDQKGVVEVYVEVARSSEHHKKGDVYHIECNLELSGKLLRAETESWNVRLGIDEVKDILDGEVKKYLERFRPQDSGGQKELRKLRGKE